MSAVVKGAIWKLARSEMKMKKHVDGNIAMSPAYEGRNPKSRSLDEIPIDRSSAKPVETCSKVEPILIPDFLLLYWSLVRDGALSEGYDREFLSLEPIVRPASRRENAKALKIDNVSAALWLESYEKA